MATSWADLGVSGGGTRNVKRKCPRCAHTRHKNKHDKSLSVDLSTGLFHCHHCEWKGRVNQDQWKPPIEWRKPTYRPADSPSEKLFQWFESRGITREVVRRHHIESVQRGDKRMVAFPYYEGEEIVNVKYRSADKQFAMESGAKMTLYGLNDIQGQEVVYFTEGELDKLSLEVAGFTNCASVPNGCGTNLDMLVDCEDFFSAAKKIIWAGDNDEPGKKLEAEAIRRLGPERCWRVQWPTDCKDANEVLVKHGVNVLRECLDGAAAVPLRGVFELSEIYGDLLNLYRNGREPGLNPGWANMSELYRPRAGDWTVITGSPSSGKSMWLANLLVNLAGQYDWTFLIYPPENLPAEEYFSMLCEIYSGMPFNDGPRERMSEDLLFASAEWINEHFILLAPGDGERSIWDILELAKAYVFRRGINGLIIDPWNEVEHEIPHGKNEHQYIGDTLIAIRQFARTHKIHIWITAHPVKPQKKEDGSYPVSTLYDVAGSSHWFNKCDYGLSIWRDRTAEESAVQIHVQKIRRRWCGQIGMAELWYDKVTGRYLERPPIYPVRTEAF